MQAEEDAAVDEELAVAIETEGARARPQGAHNSHQWDQSCHSNTPADNVNQNNQHTTCRHCNRIARNPPILQSSEMSQ